MGPPESELAVHYRIDPGSSPWFDSSYEHFEPRVIENGGEIRVGVEREAVAITVGGGRLEGVKRAIEVAAP
jgi:hypothetical protein